MSDSLAGMSHDLFRRILIATIAPYLIAAPALAHAEWYQQQRELMGTRVGVELWHESADAAERCAGLAFDEIGRIETVMSTWLGGSEITFINNNAAIAPVEISAEMDYLLRESLRFSELTGGAFDITYASVGHAYDYRAGKKPDDRAIAHGLAAIDYRHVELADGRVSFRHGGVRIDLGGIAKGYAVDRAAAVLLDCGVADALVSAGGDSRILGNRRGRAWMIGIRHPRDPAGIALRLPLANSAISTSGDYERFFIDAGERVHHIINPSTGRSAARSWSATVTGPDALTTDALSTSIFVLGAADGLALIERLDGIDAIVIDNHGKLHYSSGFEAPANGG